MITRPKAAPAQSHSANRVARLGHPGGIPTEDLPSRLRKGQEGPTHSLFCLVPGWTVVRPQSHIATGVIAHQLSKLPEEDGARHDHIMGRSAHLSWPFEGHGRTSFCQRGDR